MAPNSARNPDANNERGMPSSLGKARLDPDLSGLTAANRARVEDVMSRMPAANNSNFYREDAAHGAEGGHGASEAANNNDHHGGHGSPKSKKPPINTIDVDWADVRNAMTSLAEAGDAFNEGVLDKPTLGRAIDDTLDAVPIPGAQQVRYALPLIMWALGKALNIPDHKPEKVKVDYANLSGQILTMHPDKGRPHSFHHGMVGLLTSMEEAELRDQYSSFFEQETFTASMRSADGRKELKDEFTGLFGKKVKTRAQFLIRSRQMLERMGATFVSAAPDSAVAHMHPLREQHANHSLHVLQTAIENARTWVTDANIGQITKNVEDVKLNKDLNKTGDTLMEHVKGNTDLATQFLGNVNLPAFDKAFHSILSDTALENSMYDEAKLVREQICQLFNFSPEENISANDLNAFTEALIGPVITIPAIGGAPARLALHPDNGGALGLLSAIPAADTDTRTKFADFRNRVNEARNRLLAAPTGGTGTRLDVLFPPKSTEIKYAEFGTQLGKSIRGKSGINRLRARSAFLRGYEHEEFREHFLTILDGTALTDALAGSKEDKARVKALVLEFTGLKATRVSAAMLAGKLTDMRTAADDSGAPDVLADPSLITKLRDPTAGLLADINAVGANLTANIDAIFQEQSLERNLGATIRNANNSDLVSTIGRVDDALLLGNYPLLADVEANVNTPALQREFRIQLAGFLGVDPRTFRFSRTSVDRMLAGLTAKADTANNLHTGGRVGAPAHASVTVLRNWIAHLGPTAVPPATIPSFSPGFLTGLPPL